MQGRLLDKIAKPFNVEMPERETLTSTLDVLLPQIRQHSEDLREEHFFLERHWIEVRDDETFHEVVLHVFHDGGEYVTSTDGQMDCGQWQHLGNKFVLGSSTCSGTLYNLAFLDGEFFILQRHGNARSFDQKYLVLVHEPIARRMELNEALEYLYDKYRNTNSFFITVAIVVLLIVVLVFMLI